MKRRVFLTTLLLVIVCAAMLVLAGRDRTRANEAYEKWEYLTVAAPGATNFSPTGNSSMRKEPEAPFGREGFVLEQQLDKLGNKGWELVAVAGPANDPIYYFKRPK